MSVDRGGVKFGIRDIGDIIELWDKLTGRFKAFNILSKGVIINVSQGTYELNAGIEIHRGMLFSRVVKIPIFNSIKTQVTAFPSFKPIDSSIIKDDTDGLILSLDKIPESAESILLNVRCSLPHTPFIDRLIHQTTQTEPKRDITSYWMTAQFKHFEMLKKKIDSLNVEDLEFAVRVHIQQNIKDIIPQPFIKQLDVGTRLLQSRDRVQKQRLAWEHLRLSKNTNIIKEDEIIQKIQDLTKPNNFEGYLDIKGDFHYYDCMQSGSLFRIPNFTIPTMMRVITKTNLTLEDQATHGELQFKKKTFEDDLFDLFPKGIKKKKKP